MPVVTSYQVSSQNASNSSVTPLYAASAVTGCAPPISQNSANPRRRRLYVVSGNQLISVSASSGFIASNASIAFHPPVATGNVKLRATTRRGASAFTNTPSPESCRLARSLG